MSTAFNYNPEIIEYLNVSGYQEINKDNNTGCLTFKSHDGKAILLWADRIEYRVLTGNKEKAWMLSKSYKGFDGQNTFYFIFLLHIMGAASINKMIKAVGASELFKEQVYSLINQVTVA